MRVLAVLCFCTGVFAGDSATADGLAQAGAHLLVQGKPDKGRSLLYSALVQDENNVTALYELGKIERNSSMLSRALAQIRASGKVDPRQSEIQRHITRVDPARAALEKALTEYRTELEGIARRYRDPLTAEEVRGRAAALGIEVAVAAAIVQARLPAQVPIAGVDFRRFIGTWKTPQGFILILVETPAGAFELHEKSSRYGDRMTNYKAYPNALVFECPYHPRSKKMVFSVLDEDQVNICVYAEDSSVGVVDLPGPRSPRRDNWMMTKVSDSLK